MLATKEISLTAAELPHFGSANADAFIMQAKEQLALSRVTAEDILKYVLVMAFTTVTPVCIAILSTLDAVSHITELKMHLLQTFGLPKNHQAN